MDKIKKKFISDEMATDAELAFEVQKIETKISENAFPFNPVKRDLLVDSDKQMLVFQELKLDSGELNIKGEVVIL